MNSPVSRTWLQKWTMYVMLAVIVVVIGVIVTLAVFPREHGPQQNVAGSSPLVGKPAPNFTLPTLDGTEVSLSQFRGQPVMINFWASWCPSCREEMPEMVRLYESHKSEGFMILGVNLTFSDSLPDVQAFASEFNITFPVLLDEDGTVTEKLYRIPGIPTIIFVNRDGTIERIQVGLITGKQMDQFVAEILK
ncbi:MAG: TlpA family protein disulfide reductase [Anaerolineae bacterium]|nr:TlpA family protein disulfide reductase [Anaerolineae bacterium]